MRKEFDLSRLMGIRPKPVQVSQRSVVKASYLDPCKLLPLVIEPNEGSVDLIEWARGNLDMIEALLLKHGVILFRDFGINEISEFERFASTICPDLYEGNGELPRANISGRIYTPVDYPANKHILWHNENTFMPEWPSKIWFYCLRPADQGGETPVVDSRKVFDLMPELVKERFQKQGIMYARNYGNGLGLSWQAVFQTTDKSCVEDYCRKHSITVEWKGTDQLRTCCVREAIIKHPKTAESVWFNQATHWHVSCLDPDVRHALESSFARDDLPRNCYYGDGSPIEDSVMELVCEAYRKLEVCFPWRRGDIMMLDNMLAAHARNPYRGPRNIAVAIGQMITDRDLQNCPI